MSVPHTGKLVATVRGVRCEFDGDKWTTPDARLTAELNAAASSSPKTHFTILERAYHILRKAGLLSVAQIGAVEFDSHRTEIPPGAVD